MQVEPTYVGRPTRGWFLWRAPVLTQSGRLLGYGGRRRTPMQAEASAAVWRRLYAMEAQSR